MQIQHPLQLISRGFAQWTLLVVLFGLVVWLAQSIQNASGNLSTEDAPYGIVSLELAGTTSKVHTILKSWTDKGIAIRNVLKSVQIDNIFLFVYSTTLALICVMAANVWGSRGLLNQNFGLLLAWGQWLAALLDLIENFALETMLKGRVEALFPQIAAVCAIPKFILILAGVSYGLLAVVFQIMVLFRRRDDMS